MKNVVKKSKFVILPALATLVLTGVASVTGTVAWFTANTKVSAKGMSFTTQASSNLFIKEGTIESETIEDSGWGTSYSCSAKNVIIGPSSTVDGLTYFYTSSANEDGSKKEGDYTAVTNGKNGTDDQAPSSYVDYSFQLKAINAGKKSRVNITEANLLYNNKEVSNKAFRIALLAKTATNGDSITVAKDFTAKDDLKSISSIAGAKYQSGETNKGVSSTTETSEIAKFNQSLTIGEVDTQSIAYYKVLVRVWLEGEDTMCTNSEFVALTANWTLDLNVELGGTAATNIISEAPKQNSQGN